MYQKALMPTKQKLFKKEIFGFDCETYDRNKKLYCCSIVGDKIRKTFFDKDSFIDFITRKIFWGNIICATNLSFDFNAIFFGKKEFNAFNIIRRNRSSDMLFAYSYVHDKKLIKHESLKNIKGRQKRKVTFIDTMNYASLGVEAWGKILNIKKLSEPKAFMRKPKGQEEKKEMVEYNIRDCEISKKALEFLFNTFQDMGATCKNTISATALSLQKNKFLYDTYYVHPEDVLMDQFKGYVGGRTEAVKRGYIEDYYYYDVNSLYPFSMKNDMPNPNTLRTTRKNNIEYIENYEGMSEVTIKIPAFDVQPLPYRHNNKLLFPKGTVKHWHTHIELRKAMDLGCEILRVHKTHYYNETIRPFDGYVDFLTKLKIKYKKESSPMYMVAKLLLNSHYGKYGQKFFDMDEIIPFDHTLEQIEALTDSIFEVIGKDWVRIKTSSGIPSSFCFPIWASYITAYSRIYMLDLIKRSEAIYYDTDSIITRKKLISDDYTLGKLKLEHKIKRGVIVRPKFYGFVNHEDKPVIRIKGVKIRKEYHWFIDKLSDPVFRNNRIVKFREALRRGFLPNETIEIEKLLDLEDTKRIWMKKFNINELQESSPIYIEEKEIPPLKKRYFVCGGINQKYWG